MILVDVYVCVQEKHLTGTVVSLAEKWLQDHRVELLPRMKEREKARERYDHYRIKLRKLRAARDKAQAKGQVQSQKKQERLERVSPACHT